MDNKDFTKVSIALRDGTLNNTEFLESLDSIGDHKSLPVVLDAMFHKIANTDHEFNSNKLPISTTELPEVYKQLVKETTSYLQSKADSGDIEKMDHQLYTNLNYNLGNLVVRPSEVAPLINDDALKGVLINDQLPTQVSEDAYKMMENFKHVTKFLDLEDVSKSLNEKLADFDGSSTDDDIQKIISLSQKQKAFKDAQNEESDFKGNVINYEDYSSLIESNEQKLNEFLAKGEVQKSRMDSSSFIKLLDESDKASYEEDVRLMKESIKKADNVFDRRLDIAIARGELEDVFNHANVDTLTISAGPDAAQIQANIKKKKDLEDLDILTETRDWDARFQETLRMANARELRTFDKLKSKSKINDPNGGLINTAKLLGESLVVLNELGNADKTLLNVSPWTGTMRLGRDTLVDTESGVTALKLAALNARRKGWDKVYLNHPGKDNEAIPFIKAAIRAMVIDGEYELDQIKVPKRFQKLIENYKLENPQLSISGGNDIKDKEEYVSASELSKDPLAAPIATSVTPTTANVNQPVVPTANSAVEANAEQSPTESNTNELVPEVPKNSEIKVNKDIRDHSDIPEDAINVKGQPALPAHMQDDIPDYMGNDDFMNSFDDMPSQPPQEEVVDLNAKATSKAIDLYQHSPKLSESGYVHQPIFELVKDLIKESKEGYWPSIGSLNTKDTNIASAMQQISTDYLEAGLFSHKTSDLLGKKLNSESEKKLESIFEKNMERDLTESEKTVLQKHSQKIAEYLHDFVNKGDYSLVVIDSNGAKNIKNSPEQLEDLINNAEIKKTSDRNTLESIGKYSELKKQGKELFEIYDELNLNNLISAGFNMPEKREYDQRKAFDSNLSDEAKTKNTNSQRKNRP